MEIIGDKPPKPTAVKFQQNDTLVALIFTGNDSETKGFRVPSVIPMKTPIMQHNKNTCRVESESNTLINTQEKQKIPIHPTKIIQSLFILSAKYPNINVAIV